MEFSEALQTLLPLMDDVYDRWLLDARQLQEGLAKSHPESKVTCAKGCGACCHFAVVPVTAGEAFVLLARLLASGETITELSTRFSMYAESYFKTCEKWGGLPFTEDRQSQFLTQKIPCPLLVTEPYASSGGLGGHCGVFASRPLICDYYHSLESPSLCAAKKPHASFSNVFERGESAIEEVRAFERSIFGRSAIGHLPLLLAALCTAKGMALFLEPYQLSSQQLAAGADGQHEADFELFDGLLEAAGYQLKAADLHNLIEAQEALSGSRARFV
jgi:Fe-S-cluster containining protein